MTMVVWRGRPRPRNRAGP